MASEQAQFPHFYGSLVDSQSGANRREVKGRATDEARMH